MSKPAEGDRGWNGLLEAARFVLARSSFRISKFALQLQGLLAGKAPGERVGFQPKLSSEVFRVKGSSHAQIKIRTRFVVQCGAGISKFIEHWANEMF